jgi:predicted dehydrogenase
MRGTKVGKKSSGKTRSLRGAVLGYGFISSEGHLPAYADRNQNGISDVNIVAIADANEERRRIAASVLPGARIYSDYGTLLAAEAESLDFVDIATPPVFHAAIAHAALDAGLHVLCEKPLTTRLDDARALIEHARRVKRVLYPAHNYKHAPIVKAIREVIQSGVIGRPLSVTLNTFRNTHAKGVKEWNPHWRRHQEWSGGGIAMDHGSHSFYLTFDWLGDYPTSVTAKMVNSNPEKFSTEDNISTVLTFPNGLAHCHLSWTAGVRKVIYTIQGETGAITANDDDLEIAIQEKTDGPDVAQGAVKWSVEKRVIRSNWMDASHRTWFNALFDEFKEAIASQDYTGKDAMEAYRCIEIITKAYESAKNDSRETILEGLHQR